MNRQPSTGWDEIRPPDFYLAALNVAARNAFYEALRWEADHPSGDTRERHPAESELYEKYMQLFMNYEAALRYQNEILMAEVRRLKNITIEPRHLLVSKGSP